VHHVQALVELLTDEDVPIPAWISFNSKDGTNVVKGDSFDECVGLADKCKKIVAVGINCTPPRFIHDLICTVRKVNPYFSLPFSSHVKIMTKSPVASTKDFFFPSRLLFVHPHYC
jgi:S-methylmethionine-dependent homocysteine/selenocysteine methylase